MFSKYKISKGLHVLSGVCCVFDQRSLIFKNTFTTIRLEIHMIFKICELILEQEKILEQKKSSTLLDHP
jgi:hypothetical protein